MPPHLTMSKGCLYLHTHPFDVHLPSTTLFLATAFFINPPPFYLQKQIFTLFFNIVLPIYMA